MIDLHLEQIRALLAAEPLTAPYALIRHPGRGVRWRVVDCYERLEDASSSYQQAVDKMRQGCVVLWADGSPLRYQSAARLRTRW